MAQTYCGKNCDQCPEKEFLNCPGCSVGPGRLVGTECELARCCISKGLSACADCEFSDDCPTFDRKDRFLQHRLEEAEKENRRAEAMNSAAPILGKWLWIAFWMIIPNTIGWLLTSGTNSGMDSAVFVPGQVLSTVCAVCYGLILLRLGAVEKRYRYAAVCVLAGTLINTLTNFIFSGTEVPVWALGISVPTTVISFVGEYCEFAAHSEVLTDFDNGLAGKWTTLWKWYIGAYGVFIGGTLLTMIIPVMGVMVSTGGSIGMIVTRVLKLVYLHRTAKAFRYLIRQTVKS